MLEHNGFKFWSWQDYEAHQVNAFMEWNCLDHMDEQKFLDIMGIPRNVDRRDQLVLVWAFPETDEVNDPEEVRNHMELVEVYPEEIIGVDGMPLSKVHVFKLNEHENKIVALGGGGDCEPFGFFMSLDTCKLLCDWS